VVLGGCFVDHCESENLRRKVAAAIVERCAQIEPKLRGAKIKAYRVGLRPARPQPRVEFDGHDKSLIHNYGHGATGVSLSWGCAEKVRHLLP